MGFFWVLLFEVCFVFDFKLVDFFLLVLVFVLF